MSVSIAANQNYMNLTAVTLKKMCRERGILLYPIRDYLRKETLVDELVAYDLSVILEDGEYEKTKQQKIANQKQAGERRKRRKKN